MPLLPVITADLVRKVVRRILSLANSGSSAAVLCRCHGVEIPDYRRGISNPLGNVDHAVTLVEQVGDRGLSAVAETGSAMAPRQPDP